MGAAPASWYSLDRVAKLVEDRSGGARIIPREFLRAHNHAVLVALACQQHGVPRLCALEEGANGLAAVQLDGEVVVRGARGDLRGDVGRVLVPGIVRGNDEEVRLARGEVTHDRAIGGIASARQTEREQYAPAH